jgi:hypothetical protein
MAYDESLAERVRGVLPDRADLTEKKMFGGLCFLLGGNMCCGITGTQLMLRIGPKAYDGALAHAHAREMDFTGRAMKGMIYVDAEGIATEEDLAAWVGLAADFAGSLPPK